jgi:HEAT repeat protein
MKLSLERGTENEEEAAARLADLAADRSADPGMRCWALKSLSRLDRMSPASFGKVGALVSDSGQWGGIRSWAAYTLGEQRRKEALPYFIQALEGPLDADTGYYVLDGLGKVLPAVLQDTEINQRVVESMTKFAATQTAAVPEIYDLVNEYVVNLVVLAVAGDKLLSGPHTAEEAYVSVLRMLSHVEAARSKYVAAFEANRGALARVFDLAFESLEPEYRPAWLLLAWYVGTMADNRELASLCAARIVDWLDAPDPHLRMLAAWAVTRMDLVNTEAHIALIDRVLRHETDPAILRLFAELSREPGRPDRLQRALRVKMRKMP